MMLILFVSPLEVTANELPHIEEKMEEVVELF